MFRTMAEDKDFCEETEEGQQVMCEIMEKLVEENTDRINTLNSILIDLNRLDDFYLRICKVNHLKMISSRGDATVSSKASGSPRNHWLFCTCFGNDYFAS